MICPKCSEHIFADDQLMCTECKGTFHYFCCGQNDKNFHKMKPATRAAFKCIDCKAKQKSPEQKNSQGKQITAAAANPTDQTADVNAYFERRFNEMMHTMTANKDEVIRALEGRVQELETKLQERDTKVEELEDRIEMLESRSRICNIEIRNMPETNGEDAVHLVGEIARTIGIQDLKEGDIQVAHRVDSRNNKEKGKRPIIVHLSSRYLKNKWLGKYKEYRKNKRDGQGPGILSAKEVNNQLPEGPIYINEHITVKKKMLLSEVKEFARVKGVKYVWIKEGFILVKKSDTDNNVKKINSKREFHSYKKSFA